LRKSFGIDTIKVRYLNFFIGSGLAAVAGIFISLLSNLVEPTMGGVPAYKALAIIVLGGLGNVKGTLIASLLLGVVEAFGTIYIGSILDRDAIAFAFLIVVLMIRPQGLFGGRYIMGIYEISLATVVGINIILALGLNMISGFCGQISLGHAAFYGVGAYTSALLAKAGIPFPLAIAAGMISAGMVGLIVGLASLRVRHDFLAITTMGVGFLFLGIVRQQEIILGGELGISGIPSAGLSKIGYLVLVLMLAGFFAAFSLWIKRSWMGFAFDAVADDEDTARVVSVDVGAYKLAAFAMGTAMAGVAGGLYTFFARFLMPDDFGFITSITVLSMVAVGGIGSVFGVIVATIMLTLMPEFFRFISDYKLLVYGTLLFAVMRFAPDGLAGIARTSFKLLLGRKN
jgi:branched-chain amino acid transport system permease protein